MLHQKSEQNLDHGIQINVASIVVSELSSENRCCMWYNPGRGFQVNKHQIMYTFLASVY